jgi:DNA invertase Pin-like site-specific DNA recombinase
LEQQRKVQTIPATLTRFTATPLSAQKKRKVAGYARVSTDHDDQFTSYEAQIDYYTNYIKGRDDWEFVSVYTDEGITGTSTKHREGFKRMIADAMDGKIDLIVTKSVSRFARNTVDSLTTIRQLKENGIEVYFEKENIWTFDGKGELMLSILAGFAEEESKSISSNIKWAIQKKYERGEQWHTAAFGYRWNGETFIVQEDEAIVVRRIFDDFLKDVPIRRIQKLVIENGFPGMSNVGITYMLQNEVYKGDVILQKYFTPNPLDHQSKRNKGELPRYYVENNHEPIVSREVWQAVQDKIQEAREYNPTVHRIVKPNCFSGKIICCRCGYNYTKGLTKTNRTEGLTESWVCFGKIKHKKAFCPSLSIRGDRLREAAAQAMGMVEFDDRAFTERVDKIVTTEGEALEFHFYDGAVKEVPIMLFRPDHVASRGAHLPFPGYTWTQAGYIVIPEEAEMVRMV